MKQYDVCAVLGSGATIAPYVVVLTSHHLELSAVLVAPMLRSPTVVDTAEVAVRYGGQSWVLSVIDMAAVQPKHLRQIVGTVADHEDVIRRGIDRLFVGF